MAKHEKFNLKTIDDLKSKIDELGVNINFQEDISILNNPVKIGNKYAPNAYAVLPMEGCDSNQDGSPSDLVIRRYERFAKGGAGLLWCEANAVCEEGKANNLQMMLTDENLPAFKHLISNSRSKAKEVNGDDFDAIYILQLTHSGRYSRPTGHKYTPIIPQHDPYLDPKVGIDENYELVSDEYLDSLVEKYVKSAILAKEAGFDGVDIKACHRYLLSELLGSHTREGKYGGSFANRSRLLIDIIKAIKEALPDDFIIAVRFNSYDAHPYPYGFGNDKEDIWKFDPTEPCELVKLMIDSGVSLLSSSAGNPYYIYPQISRPFDLMPVGGETPEEHQLESLERLLYLTKEIQKMAGDVPVVGNGYTWLRQFIPNVGAYSVQNGDCKIIGLGRSSFAYPEGPYDALHKGSFEASKCCVTCSKCTQIMRDHGRTGCVIKDSKVYMDLFKEAREDSLKRGAK